MKPPDAVVGSSHVDLTMLIWDEPAGTRAAREVISLANIYLKDLLNIDALQTVAGVTAAQVHHAFITSLSRDGDDNIPDVAMLGIAGVLLRTLVVGLRHHIQKKKGSRTRGCPS